MAVIGFFSQIKKALDPLGIDLSRPDNHMYVESAVLPTNVVSIVLW